jgi:hypothetical protein
MQFVKPPLILADLYFPPFWRLPFWEAWRFWRRSPKEPAGKGAFNEAWAGFSAREAGKRQLPPVPMKISAPRSFKRFAKACGPSDKRSTPDFFPPFEKVKVSANPAIWPLHDSSWLGLDKKIGMIISGHAKARGRVILGAAYSLTCRYFNHKL